MFACIGQLTLSLFSLCKKPDPIGYWKKNVLNYTRHHTSALDANFLFYGFVLTVEAIDVLRGKSYPIGIGFIWNLYVVGGRTERIGIRGYVERNRGNACTWMLTRHNRLIRRCGNQTFVDCLLLLESVKIYR